MSPEALCPAIQGVAWGSAKSRLAAGLTDSQPTSGPSSIRRVGEAVGHKAYRYAAPHDGSEFADRIAVRNANSQKGRRSASSGAPDSQDARC